MTYTETLNSILKPTDVAERYLGAPLRSDNISAWYRSLIHETERTASMQVFREIGRGWRDFSANTGGDVVRIYQLLFKCDRVTACVRLASDFGVVLERSTETPKQRLERQTTQAKRNKQIATAKSELPYLNAYLGVLKAKLWEYDLQDTDYYKLICNAEANSRKFTTLEYARELYKLTDKQSYKKFKTESDSFTDNYIIGKAILT